VPNEQPSSSASERRQNAFPIEKLAALFLSGATLAFAVYSAWASHMDRIFIDINNLTTEQSTLASEVEFYRAESESWRQRVLLVEERCREIRERIGSGKP
jgi:hypothetical protein